MPQLVVLKCAFWWIVFLFTIALIAPLSPANLEPVAISAASETAQQDQLSDGDEELANVDDEPMSDGQFWRIALILIGVIVCWFISIKALLNFLAIVFLLAWVGIIFSFEDLNVAVAAFVSLILLGLWGIFGQEGES